MDDILFIEPYIFGVPGNKNQNIYTDVYGLQGIS